MILRHFFCLVVTCHRMVRVAECMDLGNLESSSDPHHCWCRCCIAKRDFIASKSSHSSISVCNQPAFVAHAQFRDSSALIYVWHLVLIWAIHLNAVIVHSSDLSFYRYQCRLLCPPPRPRLARLQEFLRYAAISQLHIAWCQRLPADV